MTVITPTRLELWFVDWKRQVWTACGDCGTVTSFTKCWSPDRRQLLLSRKDTLVAHALDGSGPDQELVREAGRSLDPAVWLADVRIVYLSSNPGARTGYEIKLLEPRANVGRVVVALGLGTEPDVSSDGRWLAYTATPTGQQANVVVQPFARAGARAQLSAGGRTRSGVVG
jgi:hypothetical protein